MKSFKAISILIAFVAAICVCFVVVYLGSDDFELKYKSEQNLGGEYRSTREPGVGVPSGIKRVLEVPVWDQTQGLGQRIPNLLGQQSQTPFVFLVNFVSVDVLILLRLFFSTFIGLIITNLTLNSWGGILIRTRMILLDVVLVGPVLLYTVRNDYFIQADQFWGLSLLIVGFMHPNSYALTNCGKEKLSDLSFYAFIFGSSFFFAGHPSWFFMALLTLPGLLNLETLRNVVNLGFVKFVGLMSVFLFLILQLIDLVQYKNERFGFYYAQTSVWDLISCHRLRCVLFPPLAAVAQPILRLFGEAEVRTEFFNAGFLVLIIVVALSPNSVSAANRGLLKRTLLVAALLVFGLMFSNRISNLQIPLLSKLFTFHVWQLAAPLLTVIAFTAGVTLGNLKISEIRPKSLVKILRLTIATLILVALANPFMIVLYKVETSDLNILKKTLKSQYGESSNLENSLIKSERFVFLEAQSDSGEYGDPSFREIFVLPFELQAGRAGYPTVQFFAAGRPSETLVGLKENFRSRFAPDLSHCKPEVLEFLAVSSIFVNTEDASGCREKLLAYFGEGSVREINKVAGPPGTASLFRPKSFATWSIVTDSTENPSVSCPLLEMNCLRGLEVTKLPSTGEAPFRLCEDDCLFTYKWAKTGNAKQVLLPVNFDKTIVIKDSLTGVRLKTANYQGLLAVQVESDETSGVFVGNIRPDLMMWLRVAMTYLHTIVFVGALGAMLVKSVRAVREISKAPESQPVS